MNTASQPRPRILRVEDVMRLTGLSRTTLWRMERTGKFPARVQIGARGIGWHEQEVLDWLASLPRVGGDNP
ncbi:MAG: AlpA family phage regulatory protein [Pseudomonadota bacterium]